MKNRVLPVLLSVAVCLCTALFLVFLPSSAAGPSLSGTSVTGAETGKTYDVAVSYSGLAGKTIGGVTIEASWDKDSLELVSAKSGSGVTGGAISIFTPLAQSNEDGVCKWAGAYYGDMIPGDSGELIVLSFRVKTGAKDSSPVTLKILNFGESDDKDYAGEFSLTNGGITLKDKIPVTATAPQVTTAPKPVTTGSPSVTTAPVPVTAPPVASTPETTKNGTGAPEDPVAKTLAARFPANKKSFSDSLFTDLDKKAWYYTAGYVQAVYSVGLMEGFGEKIFGPDENLTVAQAVTLAVRLHSIYAGGTGYLTPSGNQKWYDPYFSYAIDAGILSRGRFANPDKAATRAEMAELLAKALPAACYAKINSLGAIPDFSANSAGFAEALALFNAGILQGDDAAHTFRPNDSIRRSEVAAILIRLVTPGKRIVFGS